MHLLLFFLENNTFEKIKNFIAQALALVAHLSRLIKFDTVIYRFAFERLRSGFVFFQLQGVSKSLLHVRQLAAS